MTPYYSDEAVTLYHGDCLDVLPALEAGCIDSTISDPPYGRDVYLRMRAPDSKLGSGTPKRLTNGSALVAMAAGDIGSIDDILLDVAEQICRLTLRWAVVFSDVESIHEWRRALTRNHGWDHDLKGFNAGAMRYVRTGAWVKPDAMPQMTGDRPGTGFEACTICHTLDPMRWNGGGALAVWTHFTSKGEARPDHPCPKPLGLMVELVTLFTDEGETILDPFAGSGTTGVAAKLNGRKCISIERDEKYCEVAANRLRTTEPGRLFDKVAKAKPQSLLNGCSGD